MSRPTARELYEERQEYKRNLRRAAKVAGIPNADRISVAALEDALRNRKRDFGERLGGDLYSTVRDAPRGAATFAAALGRDAVEGPYQKGGPWRRTRRIAKATGKQFVSDLRHPLRHPGLTGLTLGGLVTGGTLTGVRAGGALSAASRAARVKPSRTATGRVPRVVTTKRQARKMDPGKLGVGRMVRELEKAERKSTQGPIRAGAGALMRRRTRPEKAAGASIAANVLARRQRAARELEARAATERAVARREQVQRQQAQREQARRRATARPRPALRIATRGHGGA